MKTLIILTLSLFGLAFIHPMRTSSEIPGSFYEFSLNRWNDQEPTWNFCKYLIDENGKLVKFFPSSVKPMSDELLKGIES